MSPEDNMSNSPDFSPSDSPTMQSLVLPVEVIEGIIDCCSYYTDTLLAFALTCRDLHPRSILVLFTEVRLRSRDRVLDFCDVLKAKPERQSIVQSLSLRWEAFAPHPLLSILSALRQITFGGRVCDPVQCHPSTLLCCRQSGSGLRSLTIQGATFPTCTAFLHFLSAFHSIEHLTCEGLQLKQKGEANPFVQHQLSRQLRLRTLNVLLSVNEEITKSLLGIAPPPETTRSLHTLNHRQGCYHVSFTLWMFAWPEKIKRAVDILTGPVAMKMNTVTVFLLYDDTGKLYRECRRPATLELFAALEKILIKYPAYRVIFTAMRGLCMNLRKTISRMEEVRRCFAAVSDKWALEEQLKYSGKPGHDSCVSALVVSSDGRWVATASHDSTIILWDSRAACISQEWFAHDGEIASLAFSPDGRSLASAGDDKVAIWNISGNSRQVATLEGHTHPVVDCTWSGNGAYIASRDLGGHMRLWDGRTFQPLPLRGLNQTTIIEPLFSPDSHWLLVHMWNGCGVWDVASGAYLSLSRSQDDPANNPSTAAFSRSSTHIAVGYMDGTIYVWDMEKRQEPLLWKAHTQKVSDVAFSPDGRLLLSASYDNTVKTWDVHTGVMMQSFDGHALTVSQACFSPCGNYIASASADRTVRVWRTSDGSCLAMLSDHGAWVSYVAYTPDGTMLWSAARNGTVLGRRVQDPMPDESEF